MIFSHINDVVCHGCGLLDGVHARFQIGNIDLSVIIGDAVKVVGAVLNAGDAEMNAAQPGAVRAGLDKPQRGLGGVGEHKVGVLVRVHLHHTDSIINQIAVRGLQLPDFIRAGGQLTEVNLAVHIGGELLPVAAAHQLELKADIGQGAHGHAVHLDKMDARFQGIEKDQLPRLRVAGLQFDLLGGAVHHMGVIRGNLFYKIGARFQVIEKNLAAGGGGVLPEQLAIVPDFKGHVRHGPVAGQVVLQDTQGGPRPVGDGQNGIVLNGGIIWVNMDAMRRLIQHIANGGGGLHHLDICLFLNAGNIRLARIIGRNRRKQFAVRVHIEGGVGQRYAGLLVHLNDGQANIPHVLPGDGHIPGAVPFHRFHAGGLHIALGRGLLRNAVRAVGQLVPFKGDGAVKAGGAGGHIGAIDLLKAEHSPLQAALVLRVNLLDGEAMLHIIRHRQILGAAGRQGNIHRGHDLIALRGGCFRKGVLLIGGEVTPNDLPVAVSRAGDNCAAAAGQGKFGPLQWSAACARLNDL